MQRMLDQKGFPNFQDTSHIIFIIHDTLLENNFSSVWTACNVPDSILKSYWYEQALTAFSSIASTEILEH